MSQLINIYFESTVTFIRSTFEDNAYFDSATFKHWASFRSATFEGYTNFLNSYFSRFGADFSSLKLLGAKLIFFNNKYDKKIQIDNQEKTLGKTFRDSITSFSIQEISGQASIHFDYCSFLGFKDRDQTLKSLRALKNSKGQEAVIFGDNNTYHKHTYTQTLENTSWNIQTVFQTIALKKAEYLNLITSGKVQVSFNSSPDKLEIIYSSNEDLNGDEWKGKVEVISNYITSWFSEKQIENPLVANDDKINQFMIENGQNAKDSLLSQISIYKKYLYIDNEKQFCEDLYSVANYLSNGEIDKISAANYLSNGEIDKIVVDKISKISNILSKLPMSQKIKNTTNYNLPSAKKFSDISQHGSHSTQINNPQNNPSPDQILKILDKILEYKAKNKEEEKIIENIREAKEELNKNELEETKKLLSLKKVWSFISNPANQMALGLATNGLYEILKNWIGV